MDVKVEFKLLRSSKGALKQDDRSHYGTLEQVSCPALPHDAVEDIFVKSTGNGFILLFRICDSREGMKELLPGFDDLHLYAQFPEALHNRHHFAFTHDPILHDHGPEPVPQRFMSQQGGIKFL